MASSRRSSAGERVLEGRHVIGLFFLMLLFSGVFFTLGYVMGRNQLESQVRAASTHSAEAVAPPKSEPAARQGKSPVSTPGNADTRGEFNSEPANSDWDNLSGSDRTSFNDHLKPPAAPSTQPKSITTSAKANSPTASRFVVPTQGLPRGAYLLQVAALRVESEALAIANDLRKKKFPAFVQTPLGDKYYRVQVGPYTDQKAVQAAKKGLESAGFKAIIKH